MCIYCVFKYVYLHMYNREKNVYSHMCTVLTELHEYSYGLKEIL